MASDMMLYWGSGSPPCWRVMIALEEKGLQGYKHKLLSFEKKEHKSEEVLKLNPRGQLPTFKHGDIVINEHLAICLHLESSFKSQGTCLIPANPAVKALLLQRTLECQNLHKKGNEELIWYLYFTKKEEQDAKYLAEKKKNLAEELDVWEGYVKKAGNYLAGDSFTMADVILFPQLAIFVRMGVDLKPRWPCLDAYYIRLCERPSIKASWPPHWKGTSGNGMLGGV